jgi:hypothetical protein
MGSGRTGGSFDHGHKHLQVLAKRHIIFLMAEEDKFSETLCISPQLKRLVARNTVSL